MVSTEIGVWIGAMFTLFIYSYFIKNEQNIAFRFAQSTVVGCALGYIIALVMVKNVDTLAITKISQGELIYILPILLGLMVYAKFIPKYAYLARTPISLIVSVGLALGARGALETQIYKQVISTANLPIIGVIPITSLNSILFVIGVVSALFYFFFTLNPGMANKTQPLSTLGRYYLMIYFGTKFGATVMSRLTLVIGRIQFLLFDFLGLG